MAILFQFGSNCSTPELNSAERLAGAAVPIGIGETVDDYELAFDVWSKKRKCAASDIVATPGSKVWGVLYDIPDNRLRRDTTPPGTRSLDEIEGEGGNYERRLIRVRVASSRGSLQEGSRARPRSGRAACQSVCAGTSLGGRGQKDGGPERLSPTETFGPELRRSVL
jgi:Gamma-glutamyl cyclotransferase, AIG2-like